MTIISLASMIVVALVFVVLALLPSTYAVPWASRIDSPNAKLIAATAATVGFVSILFTFWQIVIDLEDRREEREIRQLTAIDLAWQRLDRRSGSDIGKGSALNTLLAGGILPKGLDLSCRAVGTWNAEDSKCDDPPVIAGVHFRGKGNQTYWIDIYSDRGRYVGLNIDDYVGVERNIGIRLDDAYLIDVTVIDGILEGSFVGSWWNNAKLIGTVIKGPMNNVGFSGDFSRSIFIADDSFLYSVSGNISGAWFVRPKITEFSLISSQFSWAWADTPPMFASFDGTARTPLDPADFGMPWETITLCDPAERPTEFDPATAESPELVYSFFPGGADDNDAPHFIEGYGPPIACHILTIDEAMERFPNAYEALPTRLNENWQSPKN